ncbi:MAG: efflux RND transporter periplasmic adaptor subunit [Gemmatimonadaceae bacterium]
MTRKRWLIAGGVALVVFVGGALGLGKSNGVEYFSAKVDRGEIRDAIDASGQVNAVVSVQVGSQVSGTIAKLNADFNSHVSRDQIVALIDPSLFEGALLQATADLAGAKANAAAAAANLAKAKSSLTQISSDNTRMSQLAKERAVSPSEMELSTANFEAAKASVDAAGAALLQANAQMAQKAAAVSVARTNLAHTVIRSPIDGVVVARNVDVGQTVAASLQAPTIFTIAQDLTKMQLYAKLDESDVGRIKLNQPVTFKVDAFPKETFKGVVSQIRMNPTTVQNVVTYDAIIDFANPDLKVFPGMTAFVTIPVATVENALKVPNSALRYKPPLSDDEIKALYSKYALPADAGGQGGSSGRGQARASDAVVVWKHHADNSLEPVLVVPGITDHAFTEIKSVAKGHLSEGDEVVTGSLAAGAAAGQGGPPARR